MLRLKFSEEHKSHIAKMYICSLLVQNIHCDVILRVASVLHVYLFEFIVIVFTCCIIVAFLLITVMIIIFFNNCYHNNATNSGKQ